MTSVQLPPAEAAPAPEGAAVPAAGGDQPPPCAPRRRLRRAGGFLLVAVLVASALFGANVLGVRDRLLPPPRPPEPIAHGATGPAGSPVLASQPYWVGLTTLEGSGSRTEIVNVPAAALQWRINWSCQPGGRLLVRTSGGTGGRVRTRVDAPCPGQGQAEATQTGATPVEVTATGPWRLALEQEVDLPVSEPPLPEMTAPGARVIATGSFYDLDKEGRGTVTVYRIADGSQALRLDHFYVTPNTDLEIRFSAPAEPHTNLAVTGSPFVSVAPLPRTAGSMNFRVPDGVDATRWGSVVMYCLRIDTVYTAAHLRPVAAG